MHSRVYQHSVISSSNVSKINFNDFTSSLSRKLATSGCEHISDAVQYSQRFFGTFSDNCNQFIRARLKRRRQNYSVSWINDNYRTFARNRDYYYYRFKGSNNTDMLPLYRFWRNRANNLAKHLRGKEVERYLQQAPSKKQFWRRVGQVAFGNKDGVHCPSITCDNLADHFSNGVAVLCGEASRYVTHLSDTPYTDCTFAFEHFTDDDVRAALTKLKPSATFDANGISSYILKKCIDIVVPYLKTLFNLCLDQSIFPEDWKLAFVTPIYKKGNREEPNNYRPISVLPNLSKLFEALLYRQISKYFVTGNLLSVRQSGFRPTYSCETVLLRINDLILSSFEKRQNVLAMFFDLSKAFDTIDHSLLLGKLKRYGCNAAAVQLFASYLSNRKFCVKFNGKVSIEKRLMFGVPQGSVLGPFLFIVFMNDIFSTLSQLELWAFADDTALFVPISSLHDATVFLNYVSLVLNWFRCNGLVLNSDKCKIVNFHLRKNLLKNVMNLEVDNSTFSIDHDIKYLGIIFDDRLTYKAQYTAVQHRLALYKRIFRRLSRLVDKSTLSLIFTTYALPTVIYGALAYMHMCNSSYRKVCKAYNNLLSFTDLNFYRFSLDAFILRLACRLTIKILKSECPPYLSAPIASLSTATRTAFVLPRARTSRFRHAYSFWMTHVANFIYSPKTAGMTYYQFSKICHF